MQWAKDRAFEYVENGDVQGAYASFASDLNKHDETRGHDALTIGMMLLMSGHLANAEAMRKFIDDFN
jgi:hypothetical protein